METVIIIFLYAFVMIFDFFPAYSKRKKGENWFYLLVTLLSLSILVLSTLDVSIPGPSGFIKKGVDSILSWLKGG